MSILSNSIRAAISAAALIAILNPIDALASDGLVVKLLDGSVPVNQPDLFANAYTKAWNGNAFCAALKSDLTSAPGNTTTITSCDPNPYGTTSVGRNGKLGATVDFTATIIVKGTQPFSYYVQNQGYVNGSCQFTDTFELAAQDVLSLSEPALPPKVPSLSFGSPTIGVPSISETWAAPCSDATAHHPEGVTGQMARIVAAAASSVNFPGSALNDALSPYQSVVEKDLVSMIYDVSVTSGDVDIKVTSSFLTDRIDKAVLPVGAIAKSGSGTTGSSQGSSAPSSAWGAQPAQSTGASGTTPNWGGATSTAATPAGSTINRSVGSSLQQVRPQQPSAQPAATPSSLGGSH